LLAETTPKYCAGLKDCHVLSKILTPDIAAKLITLPEPKTLPGPEQLDQKLDQWQNEGVEVVHLGQSSEKRPIRAAVIGDGTKTLVAWGYPHPEEPLGALGLIWLGEMMIDGQLPDLMDWRLVLVLCADPDQAAKQLWLDKDKSALTYVQGMWRPTHLGLEVDYGFPIDWGPFYQPEDYIGRCRTSQECLEKCGAGGCYYQDHPYGPLPESLALQAAIDRYDPLVVASMHHTHTGADYTFLSEKETKQVTDDLLKIPQSLGLGRHLGEPIDRGPRWRRDAPDLIRERGLDYFRKQLERHPQYDSRMVYAGNTSAACYLEAKEKKIQFICPECVLFGHPEFSNPEPLKETRLAQISVEDRKNGRYKVVRIKIGREWVVAHQEKTDSRRQAPRQKELAVTRSMLGVEALLRRRKALAEVDKVWDSVKSLPNLREHIYLEERQKITVPGQFVHDGAMLIFRSRPDYKRQATHAQAASFRWLWPLHTASLMANFNNYLMHQDARKPPIRTARKKILDLQKRELNTLPKSLTGGAERAPAIQSQLARVIRIMLAR
jgi:hypothetical protein